MAELDSDDFTTREKATQELEGLAELAGPALRQALSAKPPLETARRIAALMDKAARRPWSGESLAFWRAIEVLEKIGTPEARHILQTVAKGAPSSRLTQAAQQSLDRLTQRSNGGP
jgi:hypothetical protein